VQGEGAPTEGRTGIGVNRSKIDLAKYTVYNHADDERNNAEAQG
jgi:hypothetical protein